MKFTRSYILILLEVIALTAFSFSAQAQVSDGQPVNAAVTNGAFLYKNADSTDLGKLSLNNSSDLANSGASITNIQRELNSISNFTGKLTNQSINYLPPWTNNDVGSSTNNLFNRTDLITGKFNGTTGHAHTGAPGDGAQIDYSSLVGAPTFPDNTFSVHNSSDATKVFNFSLGSMTSGVTLTFTPLQTTSQSLSIPDVSGSDAICTNNTSATLTNKTIDAGSNTITGLTNSNLSGSAAITNANLATMANNTVKSNISGSSATPSDNTLTAIIDSAIGSTQGDILYRGSSAWSVLAPDTSGKLLQTGGPSANPSWTTISCSTLTNASASCSTDATNANNITSGTLAVSYGGTGDNSFTVYAPIAGGTTSTGPLQSLSSGMSNTGYVLTSNGASAAPTWQAQTGGFTNPMTTLGDMIYEDSTPAPARLAGNTSTTKLFLTQTGTGSISASPSWQQIVAGDVPTLNQNTTGTAANITASSNTTLTSLVNLATVGTITTGTWNGTAVDVSHGGTGNTSTTAYAPIVGGTTSTGAFQSASSGISNVGYVLTSTGSSSVPTWQAVSGAGATFTAQTGNYSVPSTNYIVSMSGSSANVTLPDATTNLTGTITVIHNGTSLSQKYGLVTTGGQTVEGLSSGTYILTTAKEKVVLTSNGSNWIVVDHVTETGWITDTTATINVYTFTVSSASATIAATYQPGITFTLGSAGNATVGAVYSDNGGSHTFTVAATISGGTTLVTTGTNACNGSNLSKVSGTGDATLNVNSCTSNTSSPTCTVAKTLSSGTTLIQQCPSTFPAVANRLVKASGTGDAVITISSFTGSANNISATTTVPVWYGSPDNNTIRWRRNGSMITIWSIFGWSTAGASNGSGDILWPTPTGVSIDTTVAPVYTGGTPQSGQQELVAPSPYKVPAAGSYEYTSSAYAYVQWSIPYDSTHYRIFFLYNVTGGEVSPGSTYFPATATQIAWNWQVTLPVSDWQP